jgi:murein DD-endopeptidase MepM/ murein hydrolase activator NlpD
MALAMLGSTSPAGAETQAAGLHDDLLVDRLREVREHVVRRQAYRRMLETTVLDLSEDVDALQTERESTLAELTEQGDRLRQMERELDRLVPRLLPRIRALDQFRERGAEILARGDDGQAAGPAAIDLPQITTAITSLRRLRRVPTELATAHGDLNFRMPLLATTADRLLRQRERRQQRRDRVIRKLAETSTELDRLIAEERRLSRHLLATTVDVAARQDLAASPAKTGEAEQKGRAMLLTERQPTPRDPAGTYARPAKSALVAAPGRGVDAAISPLVAGWRRSPEDRSRFEREHELAALPEDAADGVAARVGPGRLRAEPPLLPSSELIGSRWSGGLQGSGQTAIEINALPRQRVATPDDGEVVFAGEFRSYGLLLIIEHDPEYHTLLWGFSRLDVELGDSLHQGQIVGIAGRGEAPKLHVEMRRNGRPVNPEVWLAASNSGVKG